VRSAMLAVLVAAVGCGKSSPTEDWSGAKPEPKAGEKPAEKKEDKATPEKPAVPGIVFIENVHALYRENEAAADERYTSRRMTCEGHMFKLEKLESGALMMSFMVGSDLHQGDVYAYFPATEGAKLAKYERGLPVYFTGRCDGIEPKASRRFVTIRDCKIVAKPK
jgi:hypothetical protein